MLITDHLKDNLRGTRSENAEHARHPVRPSEPRVLIADDQADVLEALRLLLKAEGLPARDRVVARPASWRPSRRASSTSR